MQTRPEDPDRHPLGIVDDVRRRLAIVHILMAYAVGVAAGAFAAAIAGYAGGSMSAALVVALVTAFAVTIAGFIRSRGWRTPEAAATRIERAHPESRNVVFTAVELTRHPERARPWIRARVLADARRIAGTIGPRSVVSVNRAAGLCALAMAVAVLLISAVPHRRAGGGPSSPSEDAVGTAVAESQLEVVATLLPPAHTRLKPQTLPRPERINAVDGTRVRLAITGAPLVRVRFGSSVLPVRAAEGTTLAETTLVESGYLAIETEATPLLIPVTVTPDGVPAVRVERPARDLLMPEARSAVRVEASATDDFALELLALRYTKVSGSGEQFEFVEGELPVAVARHDLRTWRARGEIPLARLGLQPGDSLVYRFVARDGRAGDAGLGSSDSFLVEVAAPGQLPLEALEMPPDRERYALSQQMIVLKIERLREREPRLPREVLQEETGAIAAEQRAVRAHFLFLSGGHVEDELEEAEQSHEIQEGRLENTARREIFRALGHMTRAEERLVTVNTADALTEARLSVAALQRAFGRSRYILRTLSARSRIDPSRRLTGKPDGTGIWTRPSLDRGEDARAEAIEDVLTGLVALGSALEAGVPPGAPAEWLAETALAVDPGSAAWQQISAKLAALRQSVAAGDPHESITRKLQDVWPLVIVQARTAAAPTGIEPAPVGPLRGAWASELRQR